MNFAKAVAGAPEDASLNKSLGESGKAIEEALRTLNDAVKGVVPSHVEDQQSKAQSDIEDLAEKELRNAAEAIERCVARLNAATEAARLRAEQKGLDIDEQNLTEAILEASQNIAKNTALLVYASTAVQREFNALSKEPKTSSVYKRDPTWAQGLISSAKNVAAVVQHLVQAANDAAQGNASEEALIVSATAVSAATAQLVTASTVKADPNSESQRKLKESSGKVTQSTQQLVTAAKNAAEWELEREEMEEALHGNSDTNNKIAQMEKQMEILRKEKELNQLQQQLMTMRKTEYENSTVPVPKNNQPVQTKGTSLASVGDKAANVARTQPARVGVQNPNLQPSRSNGAPVPTRRGPPPGNGTPNSPPPINGSPSRGPPPQNGSPSRGPQGTRGPPPGRTAQPGRVGRINWNTSPLQQQQ